MKNDIGKNFIILFSGIFGGAIFFGLSVSSMVEDRPILKIICFGLFILCALAVIITPILIIRNKVKLTKFSKTKTLPKNDENLAFIGMSEEILKTSDAKYNEYIKPRFLKIEEMPLDETTRKEIIKWCESPGKFPEEKEIEVYQHAAISKEELINYLSNSGEISKLPFPDEWMKVNSFGTEIKDINYDNFVRNKQELELTTEVENPNETWECPKCKAINVNTSFKCNNCGYSLV